MPILTATGDGAVERRPDETPTGDLATPNFAAAGNAQLGAAKQSGYLRTPGQDPLVPSHVRARLQALSPRLDLVFNEDLGAFTLLWLWAEGDKRFQTVGSARPYEIIGMCHPSVVLVDEIPTWVEQRIAFAIQGGNDAIRQALADEAAALERQHAARQQELRDQGKQALSDALSSATDVTAARIGKRRTRVDVPESGAPVPEAPAVDTSPLIETETEGGPLGVPATREDPTPVVVAEPDPAPLTVPAEVPDPTPVVSDESAPPKKATTKAAATKVAAKAPAKKGRA